MIQLARITCEPDVTEWHLKYGLNPHQGDAVASFPDGEPWIEVLNGSVGYIDLLEDLHDVYGVGVKKAADFGNAFLDAIRTYGRPD